MTRTLTLLLAAGICLATPVLAVDTNREAPISFNRDIRPVLAENCFACHGPDPAARKAKLRLDTEAGAKAEVIVPGKPEESELLARITAKEETDLMPPPKTGKKLTAEQIERLRRWIAAGAPWESHWAYAPVTRPSPPDSALAGTPTHPVDRFILARLEKEGLTPAPAADPRTLIRRLSLDLTGLPPQPAEVNAFVMDPSPQAYRQLVDRLLDSPHYGERMAVWWLDLVRYADSVGYHGDQSVSVWPYRDYVITAFNENLPFDQFTREQLAGDLLPNPTRPQRVASGYLRLGMMSAEGGVQDKEYRAKYAAERVRNLSGTWLGATVGCAECHDHKYDPYTTKDFYRLSAFFADLKEKGFYDGGFGANDWGPSMRLPTETQQQRLEKLDAEIKAARDTFEKINDAPLASAREKWERDVLAYDAWGHLNWHTPKPIHAASANGTRLEIRDDKSIFASGPNPDQEVFIVTLPVELERVTAVRLEVLKDEHLPGNELARSGQTFVLSEMEVQAQSPAGVQPLKVATVTTDHAAEGFPGLALIDGKPETGWAQGGGPPAERQAVFQLAEPFSGGSNVTLIVRLRHESPFTRHTIGRFRISVSGLEFPPAERGGVPEDVMKAIKTAPEKRDTKQRDLIARHYRKLSPEGLRARRQLAELEARRSLLLGQVPSTLVAEATTPRVTRVLPRGNWMNESGEIVSPGVPQFLSLIDQGTNRPTRLDLANWLVASDNPLVARVLANRLWKMFFGVGLSKSIEDFGAQGERPVHPELLDWLAADLLDHHWDIKRTIRLLVTSATYRQASSATPALEERDPYNRFYARQSRVRLDAEFIRDTAMAVSGLLVQQVGGPSAKPWQPPGYWSALNFPKREYEPDRGEQTRRRGLYTHWQRTFLHPALLAFDASSREECTVNRPSSNTPLQALVLLNDPEYLAAARALAGQLARQPDPFEQRIAWAFARALARLPRPEEIKVLETLFHQQRDLYQNDPAAAAMLTASSDGPAPELPIADLAAWTSVTRTILNLHETITRN